MQSEWYLRLKAGLVWRFIAAASENCGGGGGADGPLTAVGLELWGGEFLLLHTITSAGSFHYPSTEVGLRPKYMSSYMHFTKSTANACLELARLREYRQPYGSAMAVLSL